jgi:hypothetical protein
MLTSHFSLEELIVSEVAERAGIDNTPTDAILVNLRTLAEGLERIRIVLGSRPIHITSGYRCEALNEKVGGSQRSAHIDGLAADFICPSFGPPLAVCRAIVEAMITTDQIIHEFGRWCHVAFPKPGDSARGELLTIASTATGYQRGLNPIA